jgi:hypothetical protein
MIQREIDIILTCQSEQANNHHPHLTDAEQYFLLEFMGLELLDDDDSTTCSYSDDDSTIESESDLVIQDAGDFFQARPRERRPSPRSLEELRQHIIEGRRTLTSQGEGNPAVLTRRSVRYQRSISSDVSDVDSFILTRNRGVPRSIRRTAERRKDDEEDNEIPIEIETILVPLSH